MEKCNKCMNYKPVEKAKKAKKVTLDDAEHWVIHAYNDYHLEKWRNYIRVMDRNENIVCSIKINEYANKAKVNLT